MDEEPEERLWDAHLNLVLLTENLRGMGTVVINDGMNVYGIKPEQAVRLLGTYLTYAGREAQTIADAIESVLDSQS